MTEIFTASGADHNSMQQGRIYFQPFQFIIILQKDGLLNVETNQTNLDGAHPLKMFTILNFWIHIPPSQVLINIPCSKLWALQSTVSSLYNSNLQAVEGNHNLSESKFVLSGNAVRSRKSRIIFHLIYILLILEGTRSEKMGSFPSSFLSS